MEPSLGHVLMAWQLASPRRNDTREEHGSCNAFYGLALEVTHAQHPIGLQTSSVQCKRGQPKGMNTRRQESLGSILEADYHTIAKNIYREDYGHGLNLAISHVLQMEI